MQSFRLIRRDSEKQRSLIGLSLDIARIDTMQKFKRQSCMLSFPAQAE